jgi:hypothetical protein
LYSKDDEIDGPTDVLMHNLDDDELSTNPSDPFDAFQHEHIVNPLLELTKSILEGWSDIWVGPFIHGSV